MTHTLQHVEGPVLRKWFLKVVLDGVVRRIKARPSGDGDVTHGIGGRACLDQTAEICGLRSGQHRPSGGEQSRYGLPLSSPRGVPTEAALRTLDDSDPMVTNDALMYLTNYGDKTAEQPIWERYVRWATKWNGKGEVLESREAGSLAGNWEERSLGQNLARALIASEGWLADASLISRVLQRCVGTQMCDELKQIASSASATYRVTLSRSGTMDNHQVAQAPRSQ